MNASQPATASHSGKLVRELRRRIVVGEFAPGQRLPTFQEFVENFSVSRGVAQIAIERLKKDGFIDAETRQGLFVARHPPHLSRYGIVLPVVHSDPAWSVFDETLVREAQQQQQVGGNREFPVFAGTEDVHEGARVLSRLRTQVLEDRLAGLIFTPVSHRVADMAPFNDPKFPKVIIYRKPGTGDEPVVSGDGQQLIDRALEHFAVQGCRRVATIRIRGAYGGLGADDFSRHGLSFRPQWHQVVGRGDTAVIETLVPLLLDYPKASRPDGLFVMDDGLVDPVASALVAMGVRIGHDVKMVAHCNWPARGPSILPIRRIGFHVGRILTCCREVIDLLRQGKTPPSAQLVPALFEDELE